MELIKFKNNNVFVTVNLKIEGLVLWRYVYVTDTHNFIVTNSNPAPYIHVLGFPKDLDGDVNSCDINILNLSDADQDYMIEITWEQGSVILKTWSDHGKISPDKVETVKVDAWLKSI